MRRPRIGLTAAFLAGIFGATGGGGRARAQGFDDLLSDDSSWTFELVQGRSLERLRPVPGAPPIKVSVAEVTQAGRFKVARLEPEVADNHAPLHQLATSVPKKRFADAMWAMSGPFFLAVSATGVTQVWGATEDDVPLQDENPRPGPFTFAERPDEAVKFDELIMSDVRLAGRWRFGRRAFEGAGIRTWTVTWTRSLCDFEGKKCKPVAKSFASWSPDAGPMLLCEPTGGGEPNPIGGKKQLRAGEVVCLRRVALPQG